MKYILKLSNFILTLAGVLECHVESRGREALMKSILKLYNHILTLDGVLECHVERGGSPDEVYSEII